MLPYDELTEEQRQELTDSIMVYVAECKRMDAGVEIIKFSCIAFAMIVVIVICGLMWALL